MITANRPSHETQHSKQPSQSNAPDRATTNPRIEGLTALLRELDAFKLDLNHYYEEPQFFDALLTGKIDGLRKLCQTLGWSELAASMQETTPLQNNAVESLEFIRSFVVPEARQLLATTNIKAPPNKTTPNADQKIAAFVSYSHKDREYAKQTKSLLRKAGMDVFLAHEDMDTSEEWKRRIVTELKRCDLFVPLLSENFKASDWAPQEAGFIALQSDVIIAPLSIDDTIPFGFFEHVQSKRLPGRVSCELLLVPLARHFPRAILPFLVRWVKEAGSYRCAEARMGPLVPLFPDLTAEDAQALAEAAVGNGQVWDAMLCREEYLPKFIALHRTNVEPRTLRALEYQIRNHQWYPGDPDEESANA